MFPQVCGISVVAVGLFAEVLHAVRDEGLRWRDVAVAIRGFSDYRGLLENTFRRYGIPLFVTRKDPLTEKALPYWIACAYELVLGNWDVDDMTAYLRCGFSGLSEEECDSLCSYLYLWQLNSAAWLRPGDWEQHPDGYGKPRNEETDARLKALNLSRRHVAAPLLLLKKRIAAAKTAADQAQALLAFLDAADIRGSLQKRIRDLEAEGDSELKAEYLQLWDIITSAIQQTVMILGSVPMDGNTYYRLFRAVLTSYDIGMIPVSLDRVSAGDFDRMRAVQFAEEFGLDLNQRIKTMSKGMQEKLQLLLVMSRKADIYLLDEPLGGVDPAARDVILDIIMNNYKEHATVVISTHLIADVESVLDDVVFIKDGRVVLHKAADEIREEKGESVDKLFREVFKC